MSDLNELDGSLGRPDRVLAEQARMRAVYGGLAGGLGLTMTSIVLVEANDADAVNGWGVRFDGRSHLREFLSRWLVEAETEGLDPGGVLIFSADLDPHGSLTGRIVGRVMNWLRRMVPEASPWLGKTPSQRAFDAIRRAGGVGATSMRAGDAVALHLIERPVEGLWTDERTQTTFGEESAAVWIAGVDDATLARMAVAVKAEFRQKAVMYVPLTTRRVRFV